MCCSPPKKIAEPEADIWGYYDEMCDAAAFYRRAVQNKERFYSGKGDFTIDTARNVETLQWLQDMIWVYRSMPTEAERAGRSGEDLFAAGKLGMFPGDTGIFADLDERCGDIRWGRGFRARQYQKCRPGILPFAVREQRHRGV